MSSADANMNFVYEINIDFPESWGLIKEINLSNRSFD